MKKKFELSDIEKVRKRPEAWWDLITAPIAKLLTLINLNYLRLKPNTVSLLGLVSIFFGAYFFLRNDLILGAFFFFLRNMIDWVDGFTARLTNQTSLFGAYLDNYTGILSYGLGAFSLCYGQFIYTGNINWLIIGAPLMFLLIHHIWESLNVSKIVSAEKYGKSVVSTKKSKNPVWLINNWLLRHGLIEPMGAQDFQAIVFIIAPLTRLTFEIILISMILVTLKLFFWFVYYHNMLNNLDKKKLLKIKT